MPYSESVLGILAFIFAIPMAVAANAVTPSALQWWARTSESRRRKRVARLTKLLLYWMDASSNNGRRLECLSSGLKWLAWSVGSLGYVSLMIAMELLVTHADLQGREPPFSLLVRPESIPGLTYDSVRLLVGLCSMSTLAGAAKAYSAFARSSKTYAHTQVERIRTELANLGVCHLTNSVGFSD